MKADLRNLNTYKSQGFNSRTPSASLPPQLKREVSFKGFGSLLNKQVTKNIDDTLTKVLDGRFGKMLDEFEGLTKGLKFTQQITRPSGATGKMVFNERTLLGKAVDCITYFGKGLWLDAANGILGRLSKFKKIAGTKNFQKLYNSKILTNQRSANEANNLFYSILGMANKHQEILEKSQKLIQEGKPKEADIDKIYKDFISKGLNKPMGAYSAKNERALNRLITGTVSATFVGRDFYNLTMYQTNNEKEAKKSEKKRFKQEMTRIGTSALLSFSVLSILSKWTNKSLLAAAGATAATTLIAEIASRVKNGVPLIPLTPKQAKEIHDKRAKEGSKPNKKSKDKTTYKGQVTQQENKTPQTNNISKEKMPISLNMAAFMDAVKTNPQNLKLNRLDIQENPVSQDEDKGKKKNNSILLKVAKVIGATLAISFAWDMITKYGIKNAKKLMENSNSKALKFLANFKENVFYKDRKIPQKTMDNIIEAMKKSGNREIAESYAEHIGELDENGCYTVGKVARKLAIPLRIPEKVMDAIKIPYNGLCRLIHHTPSWVDTSEKTESDLIRHAIGVLYDEVSRKKVSDEELTKIVEKRINSLFNDNSMIKYKQSDLALLNRTFVTTIASYFFINDFRNQVLIDSAGKDTKRAEEVTNERLGHKLSNFVTNSFWMNFFNTTFSKTVMGSLLGATTIAAVTEMSNEATVRYSIGVPIKRMKSKEAIEEFEAKNYYNKGLYGKWIRFFSKLTGKKPISQKAQKQDKAK